MNILGRAYLALLSLTLAVLLVIFLVSPETINRWAGDISQSPVVIRVILAGLGSLGLLLVGYFLARPDRRAKAEGLVMRAPGAITEVSVESARERILKTVGDLPDVVSAEAQVKPVRGRADVDLTVVLRSDQVRLPQKQKEIDRALKQVIGKQLGLHLAGRPRVHIRLHGDEPIVSAPPAPEAIKPVEADRPEKPVMIDPAVAAAGESASAAGVKVVDAEVNAAEARPEGGLFSRFKRHEPEKERTEEQPDAAPVKAADEGRSENGGLLGFLRRHDETHDMKVEKPEAASASPDAAADDDLFGDTPALAALLREQREQPAAADAGAALATQTPDTAQPQPSSEAAEPVRDLKQELAQGAPEDTEFEDSVQETDEVGLKADDEDETRRGEG